MIFHHHLGEYVFPGIPTTIKTMGVNITTIVYLRVLIIQIGSTRSTIILMVVEGTKSDSETFLDSETWIQKLFRWIQKLFRWIQKLFRWIQKLFRWIQKLCLQKLFGRVQKLSPLDSETFFVGFRNFIRWIQKLFSLDSETFSLDSETFFVGFRNFFRRIQKLFSVDSPPLPNTDAKCYTRSGPRVGWGGVG